MERNNSGRVRNPEPQSRGLASSEKPGRVFRRPRQLFQSLQGQVRRTATAAKTPAPGAVLGRLRSSAVLDGPGDQVMSRVCTLAQGITDLQGPWICVRIHGR